MKKKPGKLFSRFVRSEEYEIARSSEAYQTARKVADYPPHCRKSIGEAGLNSLVQYAIDKVPYYRSIESESLRERGIQVFPPVTRGDLSDPQRFIADGVIPRRWNRTSGSTNQPVRTALGDRHEVNQTAKWIRHLGYFKARNLCRSVFVIPRAYRLRVFGGGSIQDLASGQNVYQIHSDCRYVPDADTIVVGNPFLLNALFPEGWDAPCGCLITSFEQSPNGREKWRACRHGDVYGLSEIGCIGWREIGDSQWNLHEDMVFLEIRNNHVRDASLVGELVVTDLTNYTMPLIRYCTGDVVEAEVGMTGNVVNVRRIIGRSIGTQGTVLHGWDIMGCLVHPLLDECLRFQIHADERRFVVLCEGAGSEGLSRLRNSFRIRGLPDFEITEDRSKLTGLRDVIRMPLSERE